MRLPDRRRSRAILVGTALYDDPRLDNLPAVANNVRDFKGILCDPDIGGFDAENCHVLLDPRVDDTRRIPKLTEQADDVLLLYYAGHGVPDSHGKILLAMTDTEAEHPDITAYTIDALRYAMSMSPARTKVVILDCCYSERVLRELAGSMTTTDSIPEIPGSYVLAASGVDERARAPVNARHTLFTGALLSFLHNGIVDDSEYLSLEMAYHDLRTRLRPSPRRHNYELAASMAVVRNRRRITAKPPPRSTREQRWIVLRNTVFDAGQELNTRMEAFDKLLDLAPYVPDVTTGLRQIATDRRIPLLLRIRCVYEVDALSDPHGATMALESIVGPHQAGEALKRIRAFVHVLDDDQAFYHTMGTRWDLWDYELGSRTDQERWALLIAMLLGEAGVPVRLRVDAAQELRDLGRPELAEWVLAAMLRDTRLSPTGRDWITSALKTLP